MRKVKKTESAAVLPQTLPETRMSEAEHPRKRPSSLPTTTEAEKDTRTSISQPTSTPTPSESPAMKRSLNEVDVNKDIFHKVAAKSGGSFSFIPLSSGRMADVWWRPLDCQIYEKLKGSAYPSLVIRVQLFIDSPGYCVSPFAKEMQMSFKGDPIEGMKIAYLYQSVQRELHSEKKQTYDEWYRSFAAKFRVEEIGEAEFANIVLKEVLKEVTTRIPPSFGIFLCKKPSLTYENPEGVIMTPNRNSIECCARTGFRYEFRSRLIIIPVVQQEDDVNGGDMEIMTQPL